MISNNTQQDSKDQSGSDAKSGGDSESHCAPLPLRPFCQKLQSWVNRLTFERQDAEDTFVSTSQWFLANEAFQSLDTESKLATGERAFRSNVASTQPFKALGQQVFGAVDDAEVFGTPALDGGLRDAPAAFRDEAELCLAKMPSECRTSLLSAWESRSTGSQANGKR